MNFKKLFATIGTAGRLLVANFPLRMAGATAFFTTFALPPMLIVIVRTLGLFFNKRMLGKHIFGNIGQVIGDDGSMQILSVIRAVHEYKFNLLGTALIFVFMLFVATTLFMVVKNSINQLWGVHVTGKRNIKSIAITRLKATGIIMFTGVLFLAVMAIDLLQAYMGRYLYRVSAALGDYVYSAVNHIVSFVVVTAWFFAVFRFLPDARPRKGAVFAGALVAGLLFMAGKYILRWALSGNIQGLYGNSGALVLILLFVFYSSLIVYYGAAFVKAWAMHTGSTIEPLPHATGYHLAENEG